MSETVETGYFFYIHYTFTRVYDRPVIERFDLPDGSIGTREKHSETQEGFHAAVIPSAREMSRYEILLYAMAEGLASMNSSRNRAGKDAYTAREMVVSSFDCGLNKIS